jgi:hypothetical protein
MGALAIAVDQNISLLRTNGALAAFNSVFGVQWLLPAANRSASRICSRCYPRASNHPVWHRTNIHRALKRIGIPLGRIPNKRGRPGIYAPNAELRRLIGPSP